MAENDNEQPRLFARESTVKGRLSALDAIMDSVFQKIKRLSLKVDDRGLADGTY